MRTTFKKRLFILGLVVLTAVTFLTLKSQSQAGSPAMYNCQVIAAGIKDNTTGQICLTDINGAFAYKWMTMGTGELNQQLAIALTAISTGKSVEAYLDDTLTPPIILRLYLAN